MFRSIHYRLCINPWPTLVAVVSAAFMNVFKLLILCIVLNIHLYNQFNPQDMNTFEGMVFHCYYMFWYICAIFRVFIHQI